MVPKPQNGEWRPCGDYRACNAMVRPDRYPLSHVMDFHSKLHGQRIFSKTDLVRAFHQIPVVEKNIPIILVASSSSQQHEAHYRPLFTWLQKYGLRIHPSKCIFGAETVDFIGHRVSADGIEPPVGLCNYGVSQAQHFEKTAGVPRHGELLPQIHPSCHRFPRAAQ